MEAGAFIDLRPTRGADRRDPVGLGADYPDQTNFLNFHFGRGASPQFGAGFEDIHEVLKEAAVPGGPRMRPGTGVYGRANELLAQRADDPGSARRVGRAAYKAETEGHTRRR